MKIGLMDADSHNYPNLPLMKISAYHKSKGDSVEWINFFNHYDKVYVSKVFGSEYSQLDNTCIDADEVIYGGTGFAIFVENGKEVFRKDMNTDLPYEIEHMYPDYSLYPELTADRAFGFLTRGCPNNCSFCIVSKKETKCSHKVADLSEFWAGQRHIDLLDPNLLACKERMELLNQLSESKAYINFNQGLDARFINEEVAYKLLEMKNKLECIHFAFDFMKNEKAIVKGLRLAHDIIGLDDRKATVYMLTNYDTTLEEDLYRIRMIQDCGFQPDVRIYRKGTNPQYLTDLQRWSNFRSIYRTVDILDYVPRKDGKTFKQLYLNN